MDFQSFILYMNTIYGNLSRFSTGLCGINIFVTILVQTYVYKGKAQLVSFAKFVANSGRPASPTWLRKTATKLLNERYNIRVNECDKEL